MILTGGRATNQETSKLGILEFSLFQTHVLLLGFQGDGVPLFHQARFPTKSSHLAEQTKCLSLLAERPWLPESLGLCLSPDSVPQQPV